VVVPRYSTAGLVGRHVVRQLVSCAWFYLFLRIIGTDPVERGPIAVAAMIIAFQIFGVDRLILDFKANRELRETLAATGNLEELDRKWIERDVRITRVFAVLGLIVGGFMATGVVNLPGVDVPNWIGGAVVGLAVVNLVFARRLANPRTAKSMTMNVIPPGFKASE
jgi:hypothetical protein